MPDYLPSVPERLARNVFETDEEISHIEVNQVIARATGTGKIIVEVCPAHMHAEGADGTISVEYVSCFECCTCLAVAAPGALRWHYPAPEWESCPAKGEEIRDCGRAPSPLSGSRASALPTMNQKGITSAS